MFSLVRIDLGDSLVFSYCIGPTRGHKYKLLKHRSTLCVRYTFLYIERVVNVWNSLPNTVD